MMYTPLRTGIPRTDVPSQTSRQFPGRLKPVIRENKHIARPGIVWVIAGWYVPAGLAEVLLWSHAAYNVLSGSGTEYNMYTLGYFVFGSGSTIVCLLAGITLFRLRSISLLLFGAGCLFCIVYIGFQYLWLGEIGTGPTFIGSVTRVILAMASSSCVLWLRNNGKLA